MKKEHEFDIALSFAGEDRDYVDQVAQGLKDRGIKVFYDLFEQADLWGKDLYSHLSDIYHKKARFTVMFISVYYQDKLWTNHERKAAQAKAFQEAGETILPVRFDDTEIPGVLPTTGYISIVDLSPEDLVSLIAKKLVSVGGSVPTELVRKDFSSAEIFTNAEAVDFTVVVKDDEGSPIPGSNVTAQADNGTVINGITDEHGKCVLQIKTRRIIRLLTAHPAFPASTVEKVDPNDGISITLPRTDNVGSLIIHSTGNIPGLSGRLNPILDTSNRTYLYANNIAIDGGKTQPATFKINVPIELEDANGTIVYATVKHMAGRVTLLQYSRRN